MKHTSRALALFAIVAAAVGVRLFAAGSGSGTISFTAVDAPYTQNFNLLVSTGTSSSLPDGWFLSESGTSAANNGAYTAGTGSSNAGDVYSFGAAGSTDRALGTLLSGTLTPVIGASFTNNTPSPITSLTVSYAGEQWRLGQAGRGADRLDFQISTTATSLDDPATAWTDVDALDFTAPNTTTAGALDGNANRVLITGTISGLTIPVGATFWIRWTDFNVSGSDDGLGVDDFSITPHGGVVETGPGGTGAATPTTVSPGDAVLLTIAVNQGVPPSPIASVTADLTAIGVGANQAFFDDGSHGDAAAGDGTYSLATSVALGTAPGAVSLPFTITDGVPRTGTGSLALTVAAPPVLTAIHDIQGSGSTSPFANQIVTTEGIVTARRFNNGFFIQAPDAEADGSALTSEAVFVFTSSAPPAIAAVGNRVRVTGQVQEFSPTTDAASPPSTEIASPTVSLISTGNALPAPITITLADTDPNGALEQLERFEHMRVHVDALTVIAPTQGTVNETAATGSTNGVYFGVIPGVARPFREPGVQLPDPLPAGSPCCVQRFDANPERIRVDSNGQTVFGPNDTTEVMTGATVTNITGVLDYSSRAYTILPDLGAQGVVTGLHGFSAVSPAGPHQFTIGTANLERFFDTVNDPSTSDVALTPTAFANRLAKLSLQIRNVMRSPDIIGVEEVENIDVLTAMANQVNADSGGAVNYVPYLFEGNDIGGIDDGLLVNSLRVTVRDVHQEGKDTTFIDPGTNQPAILNDRPPTVLRATIVTPDDAPRDVTVIANHLRSLNGVDDPADGPRVRRKRLAQAEYLGHLIESVQQATPGEPVVAVGDFNAFEFSDGYADVIGTIKGTPVPADQVVLSSTDVPNTLAPLTDLIERDTTPQRYSYSFDGSAQSLDHVLANQAAVDLFAGIQWGHSNADFPETLRGDATRPERLSDHDPVVAYFTLAATTTTTLSVSPNPAASSQDITFTASVTAPGIDVTAGFVQFTDGSGFSSNVAVANGTAALTVPASAFGLGTHTMTAAYGGTNAFAPSQTSTGFSVTDGTAPVLTGLANIVVEAAGPRGTVVNYTVMATDDVDGAVPAVCTPPSGTRFALGTTAVGCTAHDAAGNTATGGFTVTVRDTTPPGAPVAVALPIILFPANNKLTTVRVVAAADDRVDPNPSCAITKISSNSNDSQGDFAITGPLTAQLRAERNRGGVMRIYTLSVACTDHSGNVGRASDTYVFVP